MNSNGDTKAPVKGEISSTPTVFRSEKTKPDGTARESNDLNIIRDLQAQTLRSRAESLKADYLDNMGRELDKMISHFVVEAVPKSQIAVEKATTVSDGASARPPGRNIELTRKEFRARNSLLTDLFEIPHIQTIQYIFVAVLIIFAVQTFIHDILDHGTIGVDLRVWTYAFGQLPAVIASWCAMQAATLFAVYGGLSFWASHRQKSMKIDLFDKFWFLSYVGYAISFLVIPGWFIAHFELPPGSAGIVVGEQVRMFMKAHAFVREKVPDILKMSSKNHPNPAPDFTRYLYFQYIPTLVYRDEYPRNKEIRWNLVFMHFAQFAGGIFYCNYIYLRFCIPALRNFNREHVNVSTYLKTIFDFILPGSLHYMVMFYAFLHAWMNAFGEMLRFSDRLFYRGVYVSRTFRQGEICFAPTDWWNSTSFGTYYRTWNIVVHDWLYNYVYIDVYKLCGPRQRVLALVATFFLSAVVHEYLLCCLLRMFYPVMFVLFAGFGVWMVFVTKSKSSRSWNVVMWLSIFLGQGTLFTLYGSEYYARLNCQPTTNDFWDYIIPRSWVCFVIQPVLNQTLVSG